MTDSIKVNLSDKDSVKAAFPALSVMFFKGSLKGQIASCKKPNTPAEKTTDFIKALNQNLINTDNAVFSSLSTGELQWLSEKGFKKWDEKMAAAVNAKIAADTSKAEKAETARIAKAAASGSPESAIDGALAESSRPPKKGKAKTKKAQAEEAALADPDIPDPVDIDVPNPVEEDSIVPDTEPDAEAERAALGND